MTLCPIAMAAGCKKCPAFSVCPLKTVIGDYMKPGKTETKGRQSEVHYQNGNHHGFGRNISADETDEQPQRPNKTGVSALTLVNAC